MANAEAQQEAIRSFVDVGRVPDFVKLLNTFDGNPTELIGWLCEVESIYNMYRNLPRDSVQFDLLARTIKRKIIGEAASVLNANNVGIDWVQIKNTLLLYYKDKRELKTLDTELSNVKRRPNESLNGYFSRVNELLSSIIAQIQTDPVFNGHANSHISWFREKALDSFIRGLERPLSLHVKTSKPENLLRALNLCLEYYNLDARTAPFQDRHTHAPIPRPRGFPERPIPPPRRESFQPVPAPRLFQPAPAPRFFQQTSNMHYSRNPFQNYNQFPPARPFAPKPLPRPEPMEVDQSIRSRNIDYRNRPQLDLKRPRPPSFQTPNFKRQAFPLDGLGDENYSGYYYTDSPEYYPEDNYDYLDDFTTQNPHEHQYYYDNQPQRQFSEPEHEPQYTDKQQTEFVPPDEQQPSTSSNTHFLEWNPSW